VRPRQPLQTDPRSPFCAKNLGTPSEAEAGTRAREQSLGESDECRSSATGASVSKYHEMRGSE
jgi:hypothetical protein